MLIALKRLDIDFKFHARAYIR